MSGSSPQEADPQDASGPDGGRPDDERTERRPGAGDRPHGGGPGAVGPPPPSGPDAFEPRPMHSALTPRGEHVAWSALGSLLAGPIVWGGVGFLLDRWLGTGRVLTAAGVVVGSLTAFYIVYLRFGRDE
jgi:hypothetical protein